MVDFSLDRREAGRLLSALRERHRKLDKTIGKFGDDFDPDLGGGMLEARDAYKAIIHKVQEAVLNEENSDPRRPTGDS